MLNSFTKFYKIEKKTTWNHAYYIQSIIDNLKARYWNMDLRNERGPGNDLGPWELNSSPTLEIIL